MLQGGGHHSLQHSQANDRIKKGHPSPTSQVHNLAGSSNMAGHNYNWNSSTSNPSTSNQHTFAPGASLNDSLSQSRPHYQPGYLLSLAQSQNSQQNAQRYEDTHLIPTRAKMNPAFSRNTTTDFGTESIFDNAKHRQHEPMDDEDGPPTSSVNDLVNDVYTDPHKIKSQSLYGTPLRPQNTRNKTTPPAQTENFQGQTLHVIVFGYPTSRYTSTVTHFQSIAEGGTTEPEINFDVENAFKLGYKRPWEAVRALRRNGEVVSGEGGRWMVGVKWADSLLAEQVLGSVARPQNSFSPGSPDDEDEAMDTTLDPAMSQLQQRPATNQFGASSSTPSIGTPIKLAPSTSAFRKVGTDSGRKGPASAQQLPASAAGSPSKGMFGQVTDLIFGW